MEGCFCQRGPVCIDGPDEMEKRKEVKSRWAQQGLITATRCCSCALENGKSHTVQSSMFLHVRFLHLTQTQISQLNIFEQCEE